MAIRKYKPTTPGRRGSSVADFAEVTRTTPEKSYGLIDEGKYTFLVDPRSNKTEIKLAVEKIFGVQVASVNTVNRPGKTRRTRFGTGKRKDTKRAIVSLAEGQRIDIFGGPVS